MALSKSHFTDPNWHAPMWPSKLPATDRLRAVYGPEADELTIRFPQTPNRDIVVVFVATPDVEYAALMVHEFTAAVVGVQVDYLDNYARLLHPAWQEATSPRPSSDVAGRIVRDIKHLFDRYGIAHDAVHG